MLGRRFFYAKHVQHVAAVALEFSASSFKVTRRVLLLFRVRDKLYDRRIASKYCSRQSTASPTGRAGMYLKSCFTVLPSDKYDVVLL